MEDKDQTQIDLEKHTLFLEWDFFKTEIEALLVMLTDLHQSDSSRNNPYQELTTKIAEARQWLKQKIDEFKKEENTENVTQDQDRVNFTQPLLSDSEVMDTDHHKYSLQGGFEHQMNTSLGISVDAFLGSLNSLRENIERAKAGLLEGARECSVIVNEVLSVLVKFFPSTSPSNSTDIDESDNEEDNGTGSDHSGDQGKGVPMPSKKRAKGDTDEPRKKRKLEPGEVMGSSQSSSITSNNFSALKNKATNPKAESMITRITRALEDLEKQVQNLDDIKVTINHNIEEGKSIRKSIYSGLQSDTGRSKLAEEADIRHGEQRLKEVDLESEEELQSLTPSKKLLVLVIADPLAQLLYMRLFNQLGKQENIAMEFQVAKTYEEAVKCLRDYGDSFNLILMDMEMRRSNCSKVIRELRLNCIGGNIVGVTSGNISEQKEFVEPGLTYCVEKPLETLDKIVPFLLCPTAQDKSSLGGFEQQMNTDPGMPVDPGSLNPLPEEIERVKAGLREGLNKARELSVIVEETTCMLEKFFPSTLPSKPIDIDESNKEDNRAASDHSGDQGKREAVASKKRDNGDSEESRERQK